MSCLTIPVVSNDDEAVFQIYDFWSKVNLIYNDEIYVLAPSADNALLLSLIKSAVIDLQGFTATPVPTRTVNGVCVILGPSAVVLKIESIERRTRFGEQYKVHVDVAWDDDDDVRRAEQLVALFDLCP